jgi:hypothetical protein
MNLIMNYNRHNWNQIVYDADVNQNPSLDGAAHCGSFNFAHPPLIVGLMCLVNCFLWVLIAERLCKYWPRAGVAQKMSLSRLIVPCARRGIGNGKNCKLRRAAWEA